MRLFHGKKPEDGMMAALKETVAPPSKLNSEVSPEVDAIVLKSLARNRDERFATALEMARAIEKAAVGAIWHPEQTAELVTKHFVERRQETRRLLEGSSYAESTGEVKIDTLMARVKASQSLPEVAKVPAIPLPTTAPSIAPATMPAPTFSAQTPKANIPILNPVPLPTEQPAPVNAPPTGPKRAGDIGRAGEKASTAPARPKVLKDAAEAPKPINLPGATPMAGAGMYGRSNDFDDDDSEAKTIPAAALPDDIKALRKQLQERREAELAKQSQAVPRQATTEPGALPAFAPAAQAKVPKAGTPEKPAPVHAPRTSSKSTPEKPSVAHAPLPFSSGDEQSVTTRSPDGGRDAVQTKPTATDFDDDGLTAIAAPEWKPEPKRHTTGRPRKNSNAAAEAAKVDKDGPPNRNMLIAIIVVSLLLAAAFVVFLLVPNGEVSSNIGKNDAPTVPVPPKKER